MTIINFCTRNQKKFPTEEQGGLRSSSMDVQVHWIWEFYGDNDYVFGNNKSANEPTITNLLEILWKSYKIHKCYSFQPTCE